MVGDEDFAGAVYVLLQGVNSPTIPAQAGIQKALIWIPAFAGIIGLGGVVKL